MKIDKRQIVRILNELGILDGLLHLEKYYHLELNHNLFLRYWYKNLEHGESYFFCEEKLVCTAWVAHFPAWRTGPVSPEWESALREAAELKKERIFLPTAAILVELGSGVWQLRDRMGEVLYLVVCKGTELQLYDAQKWVIRFSGSSWEKEFNLLSLLPLEITGESKECEQEGNRQFHQTQIEFLELLNNYAILKIYRLWKKVSQLTASIPADFFRQNPLLNKYEYRGKDADYLTICKDLIFGIPMLSVGRGLDQAGLEWGVHALLERLIFPLANRVFACRIEYNIPRYTAVEPTSSVTLGQARLGANCLGSMALDTWYALRIEVTTASPEVYVLFYPGGKADQFLREVLATWLTPQRLEAEVVFEYTGAVAKFPFVLGNRFAVLGYTTFACRPDTDVLDDYERCFDLKPLLKRFSHESI